MRTFYMLDKGIFVSRAAQSRFADFEKAYLSVRLKESRILSVEEIRMLPFPKAGNKDQNIWKTRRKNLKRFMKHLAKRKERLRILDAGCGNGFFSNMMAGLGHAVTGVDVNMEELLLAREAFNDKIKWYYADLSNEDVPGGPFDIITFNCSIQYFRDCEVTLKRCLDMMSEEGELHIIDSPFYRENQKETAAANSANYYRNIGADNMISHYHHHGYDCLKTFKHKFKYRPRKWYNFLFKDSPFPWIVIRK